MEALQNWFSSGLYCCSNLLYTNLFSLSTCWSSGRCINSSDWSPFAGGYSKTEAVRILLLGYLQLSLMNFGTLPIWKLLLTMSPSDSYLSLMGSSASVQRKPHFLNGFITLNWIQSALENSWSSLQDPVPRIRTWSLPALLQSHCVNVFRVSRTRQRKLRIWLAYREIICESVYSRVEVSTSNDPMCSFKFTTYFPRTCSYLIMGETI